MKYIINELSVNGRIGGKIRPFQDASQRFCTPATNDYGLSRSSVTEYGAKV